MTNGSRDHRRTRGGIGVVCAALATALCLPAQRVPARIQPRPIEFATGEQDNLFSLTRSQEDIHAWELGLQELEAGAFPAAVERLHRLLQSETGGVVPIAPGRFFGLRLAVLTTMANLTPPAAEAYEALVQREAGSLGTRPLPELDRDQLRLLADRFPTATLGRRARLRLGDLAFASGDGAEAANHYRLALDAAPIGSSDERLLTERLLCADVMMRPATARAAAAARRLPTSGDDVLAVLPAAADGTSYGTIGGGDGRRPMAAPAGQPQPAVTEDVEAPGFDRREIGQFAMFPVGDLDGIYLNTGREVVAYDPLRRQLAWVSHSPLLDAPRTGDDPGEHVNAGMVLSASLGDDVVVAALQVPDNSVNVDFQASFRIISKIPQRRLFAFSRRTGKLLWAHFDQLEGPRTRRFRGHDACGPPLVLGDTVYAPVHDRSGAIAFSVAAYDLRTGELKWRRLVCSSQQDVNMFGNALSEFAASPLAVADGVLYGVSNLGVAYAIELVSGRLRWITSYEVVRMPRTMLQGQADRPVYFANNPPAIAEGVVCCTPLDSQYVLGLDTETGGPVWRLSTDATIAGTENRVRWLAGVLDDEFVLSGRGAVAVVARTDDPSRAAVRQLVRPEALRQRGDSAGSARPAITADHVWFAAGDRILGFDRAGNPVPAERQMSLAHHQAGNLLFVDGIVVSLRQRAFDVLLDPAALVERVESRLAATADDPSAILRLARLRAALAGDDRDATGGGDEALTGLYRRGLAACVRQGLPPQHPLRLALQRELFEHLFAAAEAAQRRGDPDALARLAAARDAAPDPRSFVRVQALVLAATGEPRQRRAELDRLEQEAAGELFPAATEIPVPAYVAWQRALLRDLSPTDAVAAWQDLLDRHGTAVLETDTAAATAEAAIARLVAAHGPAVYAEVAARADAALAQAGDDLQRLREVGTRFPNAAAAATARLRLLDRSVRDGDLTLACDVLAQGLRGGTVAPGILRRVSVAALQRGNRALAAAMLERLARHGTERSDWADDGGSTYADVAARLAPQLLPPPPLEHGLPDQVIARIPPRSAREPMRSAPLLVADGFPAPATSPLLATTGSELLAFDLAASSATKPLLYSLPIEFLEHVLVCGPTLVIPDLQHLFGVDHRSGAIRWELPRATGEQFESLGVSDGVVHVVARSGSAPGESELLGIEPFSGTVLFRRPLPGELMPPMPKATAGRLIAMETKADGGARLHDLDPISGAITRSVDVAAAALQEHVRLQPGGLSTWMFPQGLTGGGGRVFLPIDAASTTDGPRVVAIGQRGDIAWHWLGTPGSQVKLLQRDDRLVVVEGDERRPGRVLLLAADDGRLLREAQLGIDPTILNWQRGWTSNPAPALLALSDRPDPGSPQRRLVVFAVDDGGPTFEVRLANDDGDVEAQPVFGPDFVTFGVRSARRAAFRLYSLRLEDRAGALPSGQRYQQIPLRSTGQYGVAALGAYTVVSGTDGLVVLGPNRADK
ncbi:MAG: PQQ-binding-like beta-propeller repeat protein [Planctomycetes bacterium]|nr:PQQ-binding-like beta-propeller repeat protein [Planctomycetota bacterium]